MTTAYPSATAPGESDPTPPGAGVGLVRAMMEAYAARLPVRRICVVGNAPMEPSAERAARIDSADVVVRVNSIMLDEPDAEPCNGSRVHAVFFSRGLLATPYSFRRYRDVAHFVTEPSRIYHDRPLARYVKEWPAWWPADLGYLAVPNHCFTIPLLEELGEPWREQVCVPTTGTFAAYIARTCFGEAELEVTGFSMIEDPHQTEWRHQAGDVSPIGGAHHIAPEGAMFRRWIDEGKVRVLP